MCTHVYSFIITILAYLKIFNRWDPEKDEFYKYNSDANARACFSPTYRYILVM